MKVHLPLTLFALTLAWASPSFGQATTINPPTPGTTTGTTGSSAAIQNGVAFYNGQPYIIRNGRATLIDSTSVPDGQLMTNDGRLVPIPTNNNFGFPPSSAGTQGTTPGQTGVTSPSTGTTGTSGTGATGNNFRAVAPNSGPNTGATTRSLGRPQMPATSSPNSRNGSSGTTNRGGANTGTSGGASGGTSGGAAGGGTSGAR